jgi:hypothetical protein
MKWCVEYINGIYIDEETTSFNNIDKKNIKLIYFLNDNNAYGFDLINRTFFVNNKIFDFKIKGEIVDIYQFKSAKLNINNNSCTINSWNLCVKVVDDDYRLKYIMSIGEKIEVYASRVEIKSGKVDDKIIYLQ